MATEVIVGVIGFGTAVVGLVTAYLSRTRRVIHRHEQPELSQLEGEKSIKSAAVILELDQDEAASSCSDGKAPSAAQNRAGNKYGLAAVRAVELFRNGASITPSAAWEIATTELFGAKTPAQTKGCPKGAFLGLCQAGYVAGVPGGEYTRSEKNKDYAVAAIELLRLEPGLASDLPELWRRVLRGVPKQHNSQMHVVAALWWGKLLSVPENTNA